MHFKILEFNCIKQKYFSGRFNLWIGKIESRTAFGINSSIFNLQLTFSIDFKLRNFVVRDNIRNFEKVTYFSSQEMCSKKIKNISI